ncbi:MAG TPA: hypothetical protein VMK84_10020 [Streptosporangiaceae bacterium]|nr:hypothetical protein [Streptosporangiaceae bacterium]
MTTSVTARMTAGPARSRVAGPARTAFWLSAALAVTAAAGSLLTFTVPAVLRGTAVMNGSARGTALVVLLAGVPALACSMLLAARGSAAAVITWLGSAGFLLYNSLMFAFATPANRLFPLYLAMLALAAWSAGTLLWQADVAAFGALFPARTPVRGIAVYMWTAVALNAVAWLTRIIPAVVGGGAPAYLRGTGLPVNVVYVQDLALWLPLLAVAAAWLWQRRPWGYLLAGAGLVMWALESASIAVDQWYGHAADPASPVASGALVPAFAVLAVIGLIPAGLLLHGLSGGASGVIAAPRPPAAARHGWHPWALAGLDGLTGAAAVYGGIGLIRDGFGMPDGWLAGTPLTGWVLPGVALLIGVAVPQLAAAALIVADARPGLAAGYLAGLLLVAWIGVQLLILRRYFFLQPVIAGIGAAEMLLAWRWQRAAGPSRPWRTE